MRIISGKLKGRKIQGHLLEGTRPTMDRVKESIFAMIQDEIEDSICLDLFAGSGNLGIEAISQGAKEVYFNDFDNKAIKIIKKNIDNLGINNKSNILHLNYKKALASLENKQFDFIFLDPPYNTNAIEESIKLIDKYNILKEGGYIICESSNLSNIIYNNTYYNKYKEKKYGDKCVVILKKI